MSERLDNQARGNPDADNAARQKLLQAGDGATALDASGWVHIILLVALTGVLLAAWWPRPLPGEAFSGVDEKIELLGRVGDLLSSPYLLLVLAMTLALHRGLLDLSVWAVAGAGGLIAAKLINAGMNPLLAFAASACACGVIGAISGLIVSRTPLPSPVVTIVVAIIISVFSTAAIHARALDVPLDTFESWQVDVGLSRAAAGDDDGGSKLSGSPLALIRRLIVASVYVAVLLWLMRRSAKPLAANPNSALLVLALSGAIAGLSGATWLLDQSSAPVPTKPVGDLRVLGAALLSGALLLRSPRRGPLVGICILPAAAAATIWRQEVLLGVVGPYAIGSIALIAAVALAQAAAHRAGRLHTGWAWAIVPAAAILTAAWVNQTYGVIVCDRVNMAMLAALALSAVGLVAAEIFSRKRRQAEAVAPE